MRAKYTQFDINTNPYPLIVQQLRCRVLDIEIECKCFCS